MSVSVIRRALDVGGLPIDSLARRRWSNPSVVALIYHRVGTRSTSPVDISRDVFRAHLDNLAEGGRVVDLDDALRLVADPAGESGEETSGTARPPLVVLTFDDGTADWVDEVLPELVTRALPATFYVSTDFVERSQPFPDGGTPISWSGLRELASSDIATIGSHTHTHRVLAEATSTEAADEIDRSVGLIENRLGLSCDHFAYPKAIAPSPAADLVVRRRFVSAALAGNCVNSVGRTDPYRLGRHGLTAADDMDAFTLKSGGGARLEGWLRERRDDFRTRRVSSDS